MVVLATSCPRTAFSLVAADAMLSMSPLKELINSSARIAPGDGPWAQLLDASGCMVSLLCEILLMLAVVLSEPKESAKVRWGPRLVTTNL